MRRVDLKAWLQPCHLASLILNFVASPYGPACGIIKAMGHMQARMLVVEIVALTCYLVLH